MSQAPEERKQQGTAKRTRVPLPVNRRMPASTITDVEQIDKAHVVGVHEGLGIHDHGVVLSCKALLDGLVATQKGREKEKKKSRRIEGEKNRGQEKGLRTGYAL